MRNVSDPITLEVLKHALASIADEMALVIMRTAYSSIVRDSMDYSTALCDREGRAVAHGLTMALHLGSFPDAMACLLAQYRGNIKPEDLFVWNDPYGAGGMHLPDVYIVKPVFHDEALEGFACTLVHQIDMGGIAPGSTAVYAIEVFQEGLRIPIVKLYEEGRPNETFFKLMAANTRMPDKLAGDMRAQVAACNTAEKGFRALVARHGSETFRRLVDELHDHAERRMRAEIAVLPDGTWSFTDYIDGLGERPEPLALTVTVTIAGGDIVFDWTGSAPQVPGAINCPAPFVKSAANLVLKCIARAEVPNFEGYLRPIRQILPEGTIVNPRLPAACAARAIVGWRAIDVLLGAFAQIVPERVPAAGEGGVTFPVISGFHQGRRFVCSETMAGSWGAMHDRDGVFGIPNPGGNLTNQPVEMIEALYPVEVTRYGMVENSGGPGTFRGAPAFLREYRMLEAEAVLVMRSDRRRFLPYPLEGGAPGTPSWNFVTSAGIQRTLPAMPMEAVTLKRGDVFCHVSAGGGGRGDPLRRDADLVLADVVEERIGRDYAARVYGVAITGDPPRVDAAATVALRHALAAARGKGFETRPAYLEIFHAQFGIRDFALVGERELRVSAT
jgi:N-methylhydantoinase B